jgi:hypothetical protein
VGRMSMWSRTLVLFAIAGCAGGNVPPQASAPAEPTVLLASLDSAHIRTGTAADDRKLVRDGSLTIEYEDEREQRELISTSREIAARFGGYLSSETSTHLIMRVPAPLIDDVVGELEKIGDVTSRSISVREVTAEHTDLTIRIDNLRNLRERLQALLREAKSVQEMLEVEKELARVSQELEQLEGQLRLLVNQVTLATIHIELEKAVRPGPVGWVFYGVYRGIKWLFVWD